MKTDHTSSFFLLPSSLSRAFTLVELIVVIGIIGILSGIVIASFAGGTESARAAKCLTNMRNLAQGAIGNMVRRSSYPYAGSHVAYKYNDNNSTMVQYVERVGWISWLTMNGEYKNPQPSIITRDNISACCGDDTKATFAITNGTMWKCVDRNRDTYVCPEHVIRARDYGATVRFSYVMSAYFYYDQIPGEALYMDKDYGVTMNDGDFYADRTLIFAELPFGVAGSDYDTANSGMLGKKAYSSSDGNASLDCVLQYKASINGNNYNTDWGGAAEAIAFNHKRGKRGWCAHVAFADGHAERFALPSKSGALSAVELTALLCNGVSVTFDGSGYNMPNDADKTRNGN